MSNPIPVRVGRDADKTLEHAWRLLCLITGTLIILLMRDLAVGGIIAIVGDHSGEWIDLLLADSFSK